MDGRAEDEAGDVRPVAGRQAQRAGFAAAVENAAVEQMAAESPRSVPSALAQINQFRAVAAVSMLQDT